MINFLKWLLDDPTRTIMFVIVFSVVGGAIFTLFNRIMRHQNILKHGYPPPHCDADGDFKEVKVLEEESKEKKSKV